MAIGSIPACAGEPLIHRVALGGKLVYPRVCGGTVRNAHFKPLERGLSPRVRGNRGYSLPEHTGSRSIPACAGEPWIARMRRSAAAVYPRVCGGTSCFRKLPPDDPGLSPRVRGNRVAGHGTHARWGSIPACAGEPSSRLPGAGRSTVYPRVCGGTCTGE